MNYTNLLARQVKRYLENTQLSEDLTAFLEAINRSYEHYERDHLLGKRSLEISSNELRQLAAEISEKEEHIRAIIESTLEGILVIDEKNTISLCNQSAVHFLGFFDKQEIIGKNIETIPVLTQEKLDGVSQPTLKEILASSHEHPLQEITLIHQDSVLLPVELSISSTTLGLKHLKILVIRDISKRKQFEKKIQLRQQITRILLESKTEEEASKKMLAYLCEALDFNIAIMWLKDDNDNYIKPFYSHVATPNPQIDKFNAKTFELILQENEGISSIVWETVEPCFFSDVKECKIFLRSKEAEEAGLHNYLGFPIFYDDKVFGLIELFSKNFYSVDQQLIKILKDIGAECGGFIENKLSEQRELNLQKELVVAARQAGMMQVANSVLHNIGNVLNSINISATTLRENLASSELHVLPKIADLIKENNHQLETFLVQDKKGKLIPEYIISLGDWWKNEHGKTLEELKQLEKNIQHIKNIIKMQQSMSGMLGVKEKTSVNELIEDLVNMHVKELEKHHITLNKKLESLPDIYIDRTKLLQILVNLIRNSIDALKECTPENRTININSYIKDNCLQIDVIDNGCGIPKNDLLVVFNYGFTTKKEGHGFGLHTSSLLSKEMGGKLSAYSLGVNKGAKFSLTLPISEGEGGKNE